MAWSAVYRSPPSLNSTEHFPSLGQAPKKAPALTLVSGVNSNFATLPTTIATPKQSAKTTKVGATPAWKQSDTAKVLGFDKKKKSKRARATSSWAAPKSNWASSSGNWSASNDSWAISNNNWTATNDSWTATNNSLIASNDSWVASNDSWAASNDGWAASNNSWAASNDSWVSPNINWGVEKEEKVYDSLVSWDTGVTLAPITPIDWSEKLEIEGTLGRNSPPDEELRNTNRKEIKFPEAVPAWTKRGLLLPERTVEDGSDLTKASFLSLPLELRIQIYQLVLPETTIRTDETCGPKAMSLNFHGHCADPRLYFDFSYMPNLRLFQVCRQMRDDLFNLVTLQIELADVVPKIDHCLLYGCSRLNQVCFAQSRPTYTVKCYETKKPVTHPIKGKRVAYIRTTQLEQDFINAADPENPCGNYRHPENSEILVYQRTRYMNKQKGTTVYTYTREPQFAGHMHSELFFSFCNYRFVEHTDLFYMERALRKHISYKCGHYHDHNLQSIQFIFDFSYLNSHSGFCWSDEPGVEKSDSAVKEYVEWIQGIIKFYLSLKPRIRFSFTLTNARALRLLDLVHDEDKGETHDKKVLGAVLRSKKMYGELDEFARDCVVYDDSRYDHTMRQGKRGGKGLAGKKGGRRVVSDYESLSSTIIWENYYS